MVILVYESEGAHVCKCMRLYELSTNTNGYDIHTNIYATYTCNYDNVRQHANLLA